MSLDPSLALQEALFTALKGNTGAGDNVYDHVPSGSTTFPRITLGRGQSLDSRFDCPDATESYLDIDVWSRAIGYPEVKTIAGQVRALLDEQDLELDPPHELDWITFESCVFERDPDGATSRARMLFRAFTQASAAV